MAGIGTIEGFLVLRDEFTKPLHKAAQQVEVVGRQMSTFGRNLTIAVTLPLLAVGAASVKAASDFESSFTGVRKTVDATEVEFQVLEQGFRDLAKEIPVNVNLLNEIGESAGQLGIHKDNILSFTRTIADISATTNLVADQAAKDFARFANITGLPQEKISNLGSAVVDLGNNFATSEREIVDFSLRIAGAGKIAGLTQGEILGIGSAFTSVGVGAEAGGTAVQKVLIGMTQAVEAGGDQLEKFAAVSGLTGEEFAKAFREDAGKAFQDFVLGLGVQGKKAFNTLDELKLKDQRLIKAFLSLAGAGDLVTRSMNVGNEAFEANTALAIEAKIRYATFASQLTLAKNRVNDIAITLGTALLPVVLRVINATQPLIDMVRSSSFRFLKPAN